MSTTNTGLSIIPRQANGVFISLKYLDYHLIIRRRPSTYISVELYHYTEEHQGGEQIHLFMTKSFVEWMDNAKEVAIDKHMLRGVELAIRMLVTADGNGEKCVEGYVETKEKKNDPVQKV